MTASFPPRPKAIATILKSKDDAKNLQTLLYSMIKKSKTTKSATATTNDYAPELLLLATKDCDDIIKESNLDVFFDRVVVVENSISAISLKIELFKLVEYERIFFVDCSCVIIKDITHLFETPLHNNNTLGAVPNDELGFLTNALLIKPCLSTYQSLNKYNTTKDNDVILTHKDDQTFIRHFVSSFTPLSNTIYIENMKNDTTSTTTALILSNPSKSLKNQYYNKSETYKESKVKERTTMKQKYEEKKRKAFLNLQNAKASAKAAAAKSGSSTKQSKELKEKHDTVSQRYKQLRKEGLNVKDAMLQARRDCGEDTSIDINDKEESSKKVAQMFGLNL